MQCQKGLAAATLLARTVGALLSFAREGDDVVAVHSMDLARDFDDPRSLDQALTKRDIASRSTLGINPPPDPVLGP